MTLPKWVDEYGSYMALKISDPVCYACKCAPHCGHSCNDCDNCPDCQCVDCMVKEQK